MKCWLDPASGRPEKRGDEPEDRLKCRFYGANAGQTSMRSNIGVLFYVNAAFFLGRLLRRIVLILLRFVNRNRRVSNSVPDNESSSNQSAPSRPQGRLR